MSDRQKKYYALQRKSRASEIYPDEAEEHPAGTIDVLDLPLSALSTFKRMQEKKSKSASLKGKVIKNASSPEAIIAAFLSMECYFFREKPKNNDSDRVLWHLLRVKNGSCVNLSEIYNDKPTAGIFLLALDSLTQLARVPDILTSPICSKIFMLSEHIRTRGLAFHARESYATELEGTIVSEARYFAHTFKADQIKAAEPGRLKALEEKYWRISNSLSLYLYEHRWNIPAADSIRTWAESRDDLKARRPNDAAIEKELQAFRPVLDYYREKLNLDLGSTKR